MPNTFLRRAAVSLILGTTLLALGACASPIAHNPDEPFVPKASVLDASGLYGPGESIEVGGIVSEGRGQSNGGELTVGYPSITVSTALPEGVSVADFRGGAFDESSSRAMEEQLGIAPDSQGALPAGYSYVLVEEAVSNSTGDEVSYDVSRGRFVLVGESSEVSDVGTSDPLWHDAWDGGNPKQYWIVRIGAGETLRMRLLYAIPNEAIDAEGLAYLVDPGVANGEEGFVGLKAFDVAGQVGR